MLAQGLAHNIQSAATAFMRLGLHFDGAGNRLQHNSRPLNKMGKAAFNATADSALLGNLKADQKMHGPAVNSWTVCRF
jgi:hypothetical protein